MRTRVVALQIKATGDWKYNSEVDPILLADGLDAGSEEKGGIKNDSQVWSLMTTYWGGEAWGRDRLWVEIKSSILDMFSLRWVLDIWSCVDYGSYSLKQQEKSVILMLSWVKIVLFRLSWIFFFLKLLHYNIIFLDYWVSFAPPCYTWGEYIPRPLSGPGSDGHI